MSVSNTINWERKGFIRVILFQANCCCSSIKQCFYAINWTELNTFICFTGHVDPGESDWLTALRETKEEAGLSENDLEVNTVPLLTHYIYHYYINTI